jgi:hypothetical protein
MLILLFKKVYLMLKKICIFSYFITVFICYSSGLQAQLTIDDIKTKNGFFTPSDTFNNSRFNKALIFSATTYTGFTVGLYHAWYKQYPQSKFHFFNDLEEWNQMDKIGHLYTAYLQGVLCFKGSKWIGMEDNDAIMTGAICGSLFQTTIEVMDGFSEEWGFSLYDMGANVAGIGVFAAQQKWWKEQRIQLKVSSYAKDYSDSPIESFDSPNVYSSELKRANDLFGTSFAERFLKDYNAQIYWASINVNSFLSEGNNWPSWLNVALGIGNENLFGGFENEWEENGANFRLINQNPRMRQFYIALDVDLTKIKTDNYFLKSLLSVFNIFKYPSPALEINTEGEVIFHFLRF